MVIKTFQSKPSPKVKEKLTTYLVGSNILSSIMQGVGSGIETGAVIACCTPTTGAGTPGTESPASLNNNIDQVKLNE